MAEQSEIEPDAEVMALVHAIEDAGRGYNISLTKLVDGMTEYTMVYRGNTTVHDDIDDAHELRQRLAEQEKAEAAARILEQVRIAARERAIEECAKVADGSFAANKQAEQRYLASASNADSTSGRDVDLEYAVSSGRRANGDKAIATAIRSLNTPPKLKEA
ncbi:hypothetical protein HNO88_000298 [Novosphingobium chloroacetimidivorans]|uniref:Uncharacterized protein n=1 Tax=Novosphingobium chloroacetimidivorans TaxID=1428314 RepID=A0A7W7NUA6_9SPHN|nr:hypothetical protein [Novosphingobium chloroacetimidivorans]MBB4857001.1 hypothetical protein [Novosphingobium chloroacetimidivorans]